MFSTWVRFGGDKSVPNVHELIFAPLSPAMSTLLVENKVPLGSGLVTACLDSDIEIVAPYWEIKASLRSNRVAACATTGPLRFHHQ